MAANINSMVSGKGIKPWHSLGVIVDGLMTAAECLTQAGLDWKVTKEPLQTAGGIVVPNAFASKRSDTNAILGVVGNQYTALQNSEAFSYMDAITQDHGSAKYETAGALGNGERVWLQVSVEGDISIKGKGKDSDGGDKLQRYILMANSHDGSSPLLIATTIVRVVCQNTLTAAIKSAEDMFRVRHTKGLGNKVTSAREALGVINKSYEELEAKLQTLANIKVSDKAFEGYIASLGFDTDALKGKGKGSVDDLKALFNGGGMGSTLSTAKGTAWGALNAITEYVDHTRPTRVTAASSFKNEGEARLNSMWFGSGLDLKEKALEKALLLAA
jgi:phage/plasmid-like protein (TIGR03299 family)